MEQHPVPQNVTSFEFKLIGDITLKQFAYCAAGVILAYVFFKLEILPAILRLPLAVFFFCFGFALAFLPVEERPLDRWLVSFFKSIYSPTQYVWKKSPHIPEALLATAQMAAPPTVATRVTPPTIQSAPVAAPRAAATPPKPPVAPVRVAPVAQPRPTPPPPRAPTPPPRVAAPPPAPLKIEPPKPKPTSWTLGAPASKRDAPPPTMAGPTTSITGKHIDLEEKKPQQAAQKTKADPKELARMREGYQELEKKLTTQMQTMQQELAKGNVTKERFMQLQQLLAQMLAEKDRMSKELASLRKQLTAQQSDAPLRPTEYSTVPTEQTTTVRIVAPQNARQMGVPQLTTYPNVITGIIKESQGNLLPGVILTVKDHEGMPVRALKTNKIGQFAASTPLANGTYIIEVEDPQKKYRFNRIEVSLSGQILPPLEISAVSERDMNRAKLAADIFGKNTI